MKTVAASTQGIESRVGVTITNPKSDVPSPLLFMGRTRTATLTLASSRLDSPMLAPYPGADRLHKHPNAGEEGRASRTVSQLAPLGRAP